MPTKLNRRDFIEWAAFLPFGYVAAHSLLRPAWAESGDFALPNFDDILRVVVGLRPLRPSGIRIEREKFASKHLIHNYGHGGSGFTLSWGSAEAAVSLIADLPDKAAEIAVIGAGVIGLSTAYVLREQGFKVRIYFADISPNTTSDLAGAQWSPSFVGKGRTPAEIARYNQIVARSYRRFAPLAGKKYGVTLRPNYLATGFTDGLEDIPNGILQPVKYVDHFPFPGTSHGGKVIQSWLIEPPIYLPALINDLKNAEVAFEARKFESRDEFQTLPQSVIFNCTGLGSVKLMKDPDLIPMRGQLVLLKPQTGLDYIVLHDGYIFPRTDATVLGGTFEKGSWDDQPNQTSTNYILKINRDYFGV